MLNIRERDSTLSLLRQNRSMVEASSSGAHIPIFRNWPERWCTMPQDYTTYAQQIYDFEVQSTDVFVVTFPKSGTTWVQEAAWLLMNGLNFEAAKNEDLAFRSVFVDLSAIYNNLAKNTIELAREAKSPRLLKSHLPAHLLPVQIWQKKAKILYCARNPNDVVVSFCHFHRGLGTWQGNMSEFVDDFLNEQIMYTPYWPSVLDFWHMRHEPQILFLTYEEMKSDLASVLQRMCEFLERPLLTELELQHMLDHLSFKSMKENKHTNPTGSIKSGLGSLCVQPEFEFMRRGIVGASKDELSAEDLQKLEQWTDKCLKDCNLTEAQIFGTI